MDGRDLDLIEELVDSSCDDPMKEIGVLLNAEGRHVWTTEDVENELRDMVAEFQEMDFKKIAEPQEPMNLRKEE